MKIKFFLLLLSSLLLLPGCSIIRRGPAQEIYSYDLLIDDSFRPENSFLVRVGSVRNNSPTTRLMLYTSEDGLLIADSENQWAQSPDDLLRNALSRYFAGDSNSDGGIAYVDLVIYRFEIDLEEESAAIGMDYNFRLERQGKLADISIPRSGSIEIECKWPAKGGEPARFVRAMSDCVRDVAVRINDILNRNLEKN